MAFFNGSVKSECMQMRTGLAVSLPYDGADVNRAEVPVIYLLHGLSDDHTCWFRYTSAERYANEKGAVLVIPEVQRSFYTDMAYGLPYFTYITEELPRIVRRLFGLAPDRDNCFVAGLSMGGYGAMKCALAKPGQYGGCAAFSSVTDTGRRDDSALPGEEFTGIFGPSVPEKDDLFHLAGRCAALPEKERPRLYISCGREDGLISDNEKFHAHLQKLGYAHTYETWPGVHEWGFWDESLRRALELFLGQEG